MKFYEAFAISMFSCERACFIMTVPKSKWPVSIRNASIESLNRNQ